MTEERARYYAKALAQGMGITFYVVRNRKGGFLRVQLRSHDCEILGTSRLPAACTKTLSSTINKSGGGRFQAAGFTGVLACSPNCNGLRAPSGSPPGLVDSSRKRGRSPVTSSNVSCAIR
jgi:hypothetical protein